ncbi:AsmA family protein [Psychroflexus sediminis]|uniref:DUF748 domain-containing protein n=1 Tax=Psychroflexus sediminis TaxID=470826 RepID=A0A1G7VW73_9FLAO|nr:hypothetical protein [Psychroflexus sediminis]SDG63821.1 hypothetical protein SAMN04488027_104198 [Psychroflexus sediminis]
MKTFFRYTFILMLCLLLGIIISNFFVSKKIKILISEETALSYSSLSVNIFTGNLTLKQVRFNEAGQEIRIEKIRLNAEIIPYITEGKISIESIETKGLNLKIYADSSLENRTFKKSILLNIGRLHLEDSKITVENDGQTKFEIAQLNLKAENIKWPLDKTYEWLSNESLEIEAKNLKYSIDTLHDFKTESLDFSNKSLRLSEVSVEPKFTKSEYIHHIQTEKDWMNLKSKFLKISGIELLEKEDLLYVFSDKIQVDTTDFHIYRDKTIADDTSYKPLYSQALRDLDFQLKVDSLLFSELDLTYQELVDQRKKPGEIKFNSIHGHISNIHNSLNAKQPDIKVAAKAKFSQNSEILFHLNFVPDHEQFYVSTYLAQIEDNSINSFFGPNMQMELDGKIKEIRTAIYGNNTEMNGEFSMAYDKLKLDILNKNGSKNSFASLLSNALIKNKNVDKTHTLSDIERNNTKSFWNYVMIFHSQGLKNSLL